jgi:hemerythrin
MDKNFVAWDNAYSVGFELIDSQHKTLVDMVNTLFSYCEPGHEHANTAYLNAINSAMEYAKTHFTDEEEYMRLVGYPRLNKHIKEHESFTAEIVKFVILFETGKATPVKMAGFLKKWLLKHIAVSDKKYAPYLEKLKEYKNSA